MEFELLSKARLHRVYQTHLTLDFPSEEVRPLARLDAAFDSGLYTCYALTENGGVLGYIFLEKLDGAEAYLIDYLAVTKEYRGRGIGSFILSHLRQTLPQNALVLCEIEDPDFAASDAERSIRDRRHAFYLRNGFSDTPVTSICFGVRYRILELYRDAPSDAESIRSLYRRIYLQLLPKEICVENVILPTQD